MKRHLLPHPVHGFRATLISYPAIFCYFVFVVSLNFLAHKISYQYPQILGYASDINIYDLLNDTNAKRADNGLAVLTLNDQLNVAAQNKAQDMFNNDYWAHVAPSGTTPWSFILGSGYDYQYAGENLARDFDHSGSVVTAWMNSPTHRDNLLSPKYKEIGFAVVNGELQGEETTLVVQMFGASRIAMAPTPIAKTPEISEVAVTASINEVQGAMSPRFDLRVASRIISLFLGSFMLGLFILDAWYVKKYHIHRLSGNTVAHIMLLMVALAGIWYSGLGVVL